MKRNNWKEVKLDFNIQGEMPKLTMIRIRKKDYGIGRTKVTFGNSAVDCIAARCEDERHISTEAAIIDWLKARGLAEWEIKLLLKTYAKPVSSNPYPSELTMAKSVFKDVAAWAQITFGRDGERGPIGPLKHMLKEIQDELLGNDPTDIKEYADVYILLCDAVRRGGHDFSSLIKAAEEKMEVNRQRDYPMPTGNEVSEHVRTPEELAAKTRNQDPVSDWTVTQCRDWLVANDRQLPAQNPWTMSRTDLLIALFGANDVESQQSDEELRSMLIQQQINTSMADFTAIWQKAVKSAMNLSPEEAAEMGMYKPED